MGARNQSLAFPHCSRFLGAQGNAAGIRAGRFSNVPALTVTPADPPSELLCLGHCPPSYARSREEARAGEGIRTAARHPTEGVPTSGTSAGPYIATIIPLDLRGERESTPVRRAKGPDTPAVPMSRGAGHRPETTGVHYRPILGDERSRSEPRGRG